MDSLSQCKFYFTISPNFFTCIGLGRRWAGPTDPDGMLEHLKDIPRQIVAIVAGDPAVLDSYENFLVALRGPR